MDALDLFDKIADYLFQLQGNISFKMRVINHIPRNDFTNVIELSNIQYCYDDSDNELLRRALPPKFEAYIKTTNDEIKIIFSKLPSFKTWAYDEKGNSKQVYSNDQVTIYCYVASFDEFIKAWDDMALYIKNHTIEYYKDLLAIDEMKFDWERERLPRF